MEIKIECPCGQPFEFDVTPENGQMPCEVNCPGCGVDATALANAFIRKQLAARPGPFAAQPATVVPPVARPPLPTPRPVAEPVRRVAKPKDREALAFRNGLIAAAVCAAVGMAGWFSLIYYGHIEIGWAAWGVGALTGLGARIFGEGGSTLGALCALFAAIAIVGGHALGTDLTHFSPFIILFLFLGVGSAYKIGAGSD